MGRMGAHDVVPVSSNGLFAVIAVMAAMLAGAVAVPTVANADKVRNGLIAYTTGNGEEERYTIWTIKPDGTANRRLLGADSRFEGGSSGPRWSRGASRCPSAVVRSRDMTGRQTGVARWCR